MLFQTYDDDDDAAAAIIQEEDIQHEYAAPSKKSAKANNWSSTELSLSLNGGGNSGTVTLLRLKLFHDHIDE